MLIELREQTYTKPNIRPQRNQPSMTMLLRTLQGAIPRTLVLVRRWRRLGRRAGISVISLAIASIIFTHIRFEETLGRMRSLNAQLSDEYKNCSSASSRIVFLKTHKCASTTVENIILRYAKKNALNIAMPIVGSNWGKTKKFHRSMLKGTPWDAAKMKYDVFCLHAVWDYAEVSTVMGSSDVPYVTILRDPADLFISIWDYNSKWSTYYNMSLETFAMADIKPGPTTDRKFRANMGRNQLLFDMGLDPSDFDNISAVTKKIQEVADTFDLVMLADRFDESVVLLKDLLCWDSSDMTYLKLNVHNKKTKTVLSAEAMNKLKAWLNADYMLYSHFEKQFKQRITDFGTERMQHELDILRAANDDVYSKCVEKTVSNDQLEGPYKMWGMGLVGYHMREDSEGFCKYYSISEPAFIDELRAAQTERAQKILSVEASRPLVVEPQ